MYIIIIIISRGLHQTYFDVRTHRHPPQKSGCVSLVQDISSLLLPWLDLGVEKASKQDGKPGCRPGPTGCVGDMFKGASEGV